MKTWRQLELSGVMNECHHGCHCYSTILSLSVSELAKIRSFKNESHLIEVPEALKHK